MARADKFTFLTKQPLYYSDFLDDFSLNPVTGNLASVLNEDSVRQAVKNLILTPRTARYKQPMVGSKVATLLFDIWTSDTFDLLISTARETIQNFEPRAQSPQITVDGHPELNYVTMHIQFNVINIPEAVTFDLILKRAR